MEEISVKGENYIKAAIIAEKFGYTADYVGQLCRGRQVKATLVGRSWYVSEKSLREHKKGRYRSTLAKSKESVRKLAEKQAHFSEPRFMQRIASYEPDEGDLIPVVAKATESFESDLKEEISVSKKPENKPQNAINIRSAEKRPEARIERKAPQIRIISAQANTARSISDNKQRRTQPIFGGRLVTVGTSTGALLLALCLSVVIVGLEKRVVPVEDGAEVILYNFDFEPIKKAVEVYL